MVERDKILQVEPGVDAARLLPVQVPVCGEDEPFKDRKEILQSDLFDGLTGPGHADFDEGPSLVGVLRKIVGAGDFLQAAGRALLRVLNPPFVRNRQPGGLKSCLVTGEKALVKGPAAVLIEGGGPEASDDEGQAGKGHSGIAVVLDDEVEAAPGADIEQGLMAHGRQAVLRLEGQTVPEAKQDADMDVAIAEEGNGGEGASRRGRGEAGLELEDFPFDGLDERSVSGANPVEATLAIRADCGPEVATRSHRRNGRHRRREEADGRMPGRRILRPEESLQGRSKLTESTKRSAEYVARRLVHASRPAMSRLSCEKPPSWPRPGTPGAQATTRPAILAKAGEREPSLALRSVTGGKLKVGIRPGGLWGDAAAGRGIPSMTVAEDLQVMRRTNGGGTDSLEVEDGRVGHDGPMWKGLWSAEVRATV